MITQSKFTDELKTKIYAGLGNTAVDAKGINGLAEDPIAFIYSDGKEFMGAIVAQIFWGQLHIKLLLVEEKYRHHGIGRKLLAHTFEFGNKRGCTFAFVETFNFQALPFYQKLGFILEFTRIGFSNGVKIHYLKREL